jgi:hypothetical protein
LLLVVFPDDSGGQRMNAPDTTSEVTELLTPRELADRWTCSVGHLANLRSAGLAPTYLKIGTAVRYRLADVLAYEAARVVTPA